MTENFTILHKSRVLNTQSFIIYLPDHHCKGEQGKNKMIFTGRDWDKDWDKVNFFSLEF